MGEEDRHSLLQELDLVEPRVTSSGMSTLKLLIDDCVYSGVVVHNASKATHLDLYVHCNHGFGANSSSFQPFFNELRRFPSISAVAHDTYGFGFTVPVKAAIPLNELSLLSNGNKTTSRIMKHILVEQGYKQVKNVCLVGHSMGCISTVAAAYSLVHESQQKNVSIILIAPAIIADQSNNINKFYLATTYPIQAIFQLIIMLKYCLTQSCRYYLCQLLLYVLTHIPGFWSIGLHVAYGFKAGHPTSEFIKSYSAPMRRPNWTSTLIQFLDAHLWTPNPSQESVSMHTRISYLLDNNVKVIVVHDPSDLLVPVSRSYQLQQEFGYNAEGEYKIKLEIVSDLAAGHMPHESDPHHLVSLLKKYEILNE